MSKPRQIDPSNRAMAASLAVAFVMLVGKMAAYALTDSAAIFSDAMESVVHVLATAFAGFSLWFARLPADPKHPYGHGKIAYFSTGIEGLLIIVAAVGIVASAGQALATGAAPRQLGLGVALLAALALVNLALGMLLLRTGRREHSLVLVSNGHHVLADFWTSAGVVLGVVLVWQTRIAWLDPAIAFAVAGHILWTGARLVRGAVHGLMESADQDDTERLVATLEAAVAAGDATGYHQLRHRRAGAVLFVEYHIELPGTLSLADAHARAHAVEDAIQAAYPGLDVHVTAHLEPEEHDASHPAGFAEPHDPLGMRG